MNEANPPAPERRPADLTALLRELKAMATRVKATAQEDSDRARRAHEPVLVIRAK
jgi:hypothetical protein